MTHVSRPDRSREPKWAMLRMKFDVRLEDIDIMVQADFTGV
jgi:hypothetical protein